MSLVGSRVKLGLDRFNSCSSRFSSPLDLFEPVQTSFAKLEPGSSHLELDSLDF